MFLVVAPIGVRAGPARFRTIWPIIAGCIAFGLVMAWKLV
jgi:hypothetical protein